MVFSCFLFSYIRAQKRNVQSYIYYQWVSVILNHNLCLKSNKWKIKFQKKKLNCTYFQRPYLLDIIGVWHWVHPYKVHLRAVDGRFILKRTPYLYIWTLGAGTRCIDQKYCENQLSALSKILDNSYASPLDLLTYSPLYDSIVELFYSSRIDIEPITTNECVWWCSNARNNISCVSCHNERGTERQT